MYDFDNVEKKEKNIYNNYENMLEDDEISAIEQGFMSGYDCSLEEE